MRSSTMPKPVAVVKEPSPDVRDEAAMVMAALAASASSIPKPKSPKPVVLPTPDEISSHVLSTLQIPIVQVPQTKSPQPVAVAAARPAVLPTVMSQQYMQHPSGVTAAMYPQEAVTLSPDEMQQAHFYGETLKASALNEAQQVYDACLARGLSDAQAQEEAGRFWIQATSNNQQLYDFHMNTILQRRLQAAVSHNQHRPPEAGSRLPTKDVTMNGGSTGAYGSSPSSFGSSLAFLCKTADEKLSPPAPTLLPLTKKVNSKSSSQIFTHTSKKNASAARNVASAVPRPVTVVHVLPTASVVASALPPVASSVIVLVPNETLQVSAEVPATSAATAVDVSSVEKWRKSMVGKTIEVEFGEEWYSAEIEGYKSGLFTVSYEGDNTEERMRLFENGTAQDPAGDDEFNWRLLLRLNLVARKRAVSNTKSAANTPRAPEAASASLKSWEDSNRVGRERRARLRAELNAKRVEDKAIEEKLKDAREIDSEKLKLDQERKMLEEDRKKLNEEKRRAEEERKELEEQKRRNAELRKSLESDHNSSRRLSTGSTPAGGDEEEENVDFWPLKSSVVVVEKKTSDEKMSNGRGRGHVMLKKSNGGGGAGPGRQKSIEPEPGKPLVGKGSRKSSAEVDLIMESDDEMPAAKKARLSIPMVKARVSVAAHSNDSRKKEEAAAAAASASESEESSDESGLESGNDALASKSKGKRTGRKPGPKPGKKKRSFSDPPAMLRWSTRKPPKVAKTPKTLGYIPKGKFGFRPPTKITAINWRVRVWWKDDNAFYPGIVSAYRDSTGKHRILYDDGDKEALNLDKETIEWWVPEGVPLEGLNIDTDAAFR